MMKSSKKYYKIAFYAIGIAILLYLMNEYGFTTIWQQIREVSWYFLAIVLLGGVVYLLNAFAWKTIIDTSNEKISFRKIYGLVVAGYGINYITPFVGLGGEPYRIMALSKTMSKSKAATLVSQYSLMHMYSHIWFWLLGLMIMILNLGIGNSNLWIYLVSFVLIAVMFVLFTNLFRNGFLYRTFKFASKIPLINRIAERYSDKQEEIKKLDKEIAFLYNENKASFYKSLLIEIISRIINALEFMIILMAIGVDISVLDAIYISAASSLIANIVFFLPMQIGVREGGLYFVMSTLGMNPGLGIILGLVSRLREFVWIAIGFLIMPIIDRKTKMELNK
jgi:uncharacterized protein (TIRG00374 family)